MAVRERRKLSVVECMFDCMELVERVAELDAGAACEAVVAAHARLLAAEAERFVLAAHWADLHSGEALEEQRRRRGGRVVRGMERGRQVGADGTPWVAEFAAMELGALQGMGPVAAGCLIRDALNVRHRHPLLWEAVVTGTARVWQARKVAQMCAGAGLGEGQAKWVDEQTTAYACSLPWSRFEALVEAKIVEVDPAGAEARRLAAAMARFVRTGRSSEFGLRTVVARAAAGDVVFFVAMVDRIAEVLAEQGDDDPVDVRRSKAIGILADPARALVMLTESAVRAAGGGPTDTDDDDHAGGGACDGDSDSGDDADADAGRGAGPTDDPEPDPEADPDAEPDPEPDPVGRIARPEWVAALTRLRELAALDPGLLKVLRPQAVLYVHVAAESLHTGTGVARMEGTGPLTVPQLVEFLGHCYVRPVQVLDPLGQTPVDAYEVPARMRESLHLLQPASVAPWSVNLSRRKDADHVKAYVPPEQGGPPGQTSMDNLAPLDRFPHRVKTHGRWRLRQRAPGVYEWRSPHGYRFLVDHDGTHPLGREPAAGRAAPAQGAEKPTHPTPVVEIWRTPIRIDYTGLIDHAS